MPTKTQTTDNDIITNSDESQSENADQSDTNANSESFGAWTFGPDNGGDVVIDAYRFLYWVFDCRVERFDVTPEGVYAVDVTMADGINPQSVVKDMGGGTRHPRLDLVALYPYTQGQTPEMYEGENAGLDLTRALTANFRSEENGGRSPDYAKNRVALFKKANSLDKPRGRKPTKILEQVTSLDAKTLAGIDPDNLEKLLATIREAQEIRSHEPVTAS